MDDGTVTICSTCRNIVDPSDDALVYAVELIRAETFGASEVIEGLGAFFHPRCFPGEPRYRRKPLPPLA